MMKLLTTPFDNEQRTLFPKKVRNLKGPFLEKVRNPALLWRLIMTKFTASRLKEARKTANMTQNEVANALGMSVRYDRNLRRGEV